MSIEHDNGRLNHDTQETPKLIDQNSELVSSQSEAPLPLFLQKFFENPVAVKMLGTLGLTAALGLANLSVQDQMNRFQQTRHIKVQQALMMREPTLAVQVKSQFPLETNEQIDARVAALNAEYEQVLRRDKAIVDMATVSAPVMGTLWATRGKKKKVRIPVKKK